MRFYRRCGETKTRVVRVNASIVASVRVIEYPVFVRQAIRSMAHEAISRLYYRADCIEQKDSDNVLFLTKFSIIFSEFNINAVF